MCCTRSCPPSPWPTASGASASVETRERRLFTVGRAVNRRVAHQLWRRPRHRRLATAPSAAAAARLSHRHGRLLGVLAVDGQAARGHALHRWVVTFHQARCRALGGLYVFMYFRYEMRGVRYESLARHAFAASLGLLGSCDANTWLLTRPARTFSEPSSRHLRRRRLAADAARREPLGAAACRLVGQETLPRHFLDTP